MSRDKPLKPKREPESERPWDKSEKGVRWAWTLLEKSGAILEHQARLSLQKGLQELKPKSNFLLNFDDTVRPLTYYQDPEILRRYFLLKKKPMQGVISLGGGVDDLVEAFGKPETRELDFSTSLILHHHRREERQMETEIRFFGECKYRAGAEYLVIPTEQDIAPSWPFIDFATFQEEYKDSGTGKAKAFERSLLVRDWSWFKWFLQKPVSSHRIVAFPADGKSEKLLTENTIWDASQQLLDAIRWDQIGYNLVLHSLGEEYIESDPCFLLQVPIVVVNGRLHEVIFPENGVRGSFRETPYCVFHFRIPSKHLHPYRLCTVPYGGLQFRDYVSVIVTTVQGLNPVLQGLFKASESLLEKLLIEGNK